MRRVLDAPLPGPENFIWPVFVRGGIKIHEPLAAMPGQARMSPDVLVKELERVVASGIGGVLVFGLPDGVKSDDGRSALDPTGAVPTAIREIRREFPQLAILSDVCVCAYTDHGHCGILARDGDIDNDATNKLLAEMALVHAAAGATMVAPSAMMDGQVSSLRQALDGAGFQRTGIMAYSTKFASACYGPFREAGESAPQHGDRRGYQCSYRNIDLAIRESILDEKEGADILMVKPALFYLDVIERLKRTTHLPLAAYNVSGEYSMLIATAQQGWGDLRALVRESTMAIARSGADILISYWANRYEEFFRE